MTLSYVTVSIDIGKLPVCVPAARGFVDFTLTGADVDGALIVPMRVRAPLDENALGSAQLWPPTRGRNGVQYRYEVYGYGGSPLLLSGTCTPTEVDCALHDIIDLVAPPSVDDAVAAKNLAVQAAADAELDRQATEADRAQTALDRIATGKDRERTGIDREAVEGIAAEFGSLGGAISAAQIAAETATDQADAAATQAQQADLARVLAEAARDVANTSARAYTAAQGTAAALADAGLAVGQTFAVVSTDGTQWVLYRKDAGPVATMLIAQYGRGYIDGMARQSTDQTNHWQRWSDEGGYAGALFDATSLRTKQWAIGRYGLETPEFGIRDHGTGLELVMTDEGGYGVRLKLRDVQTAAEDAASENVDRPQYRITPAPAGLRFGVRDEGGYYAVYVPDGESLRGTRQLEADVYQLKRDVIPTIGAAMPTPRIPMSAHRGVHMGGVSAPENSLDSAYLAARAGFRVLEIDCQRTSDGEYIAMHDGSINRTCRMASDYSAIPTTVNVISSTAATLRSTYVLAATQPRYRRPIPTLDEMLRVCRDNALLPLIEFKDTVNMTNTDVLAIFNKCLAALGDGNFAFQSFVPSMLTYARTLSTRIGLYFNYSTIPTSAQLDVIQAAAGVLFINAPAVTSGLVADVRARGIKLATWTVETLRYDSQVKLGVDEMSTDFCAPDLRDQHVIYRSYSGTAYDGWLVAGVLADGVATLAQGQRLILNAPKATASVPFGAWYLSLDFKGAASITATRMTASLTNTAAGADWRRSCHQALMFEESCAITILAGTGGCQIKDIALAIAQF